MRPYIYIFFPLRYPISTIYEILVILFYTCLVWETVVCVCRIPVTAEKIEIGVQIPAWSIAFNFAEMPLRRHESISPPSSFRLHSKQCPLSFWVATSLRKRIL